jgi:hypothetical protein
MNTMNPVIFMPRVMPHIGSGGGGSNVDGLLLMLSTFAIVGVILIILGILANILRIKFSQGDEPTPICWDNINADLDNSFLGALCWVFGIAFIGTAALMGLVAGIFWFIITL